MNVRQNGVFRMTYRELILEFDFPDVKASYEGETATDPVSLAVENNLLLQLLDNHEQFEPAQRERVLIEIGQQLFEALFSSRIFPLYLRALAEQRQTPEAALRIRIIASDTRLLTLPWEFMYDCRQAVFPASVPETPVVRTLGPRGEGEVLQPYESVRLLLVGASPPDAPALDYQAEIEAIVEAARGASAEVQVLTSATWAGFRERLKAFQPHIVHFMGHGFTDEKGTGILLEDPRLGGSHRVDAAKLAEGILQAQPRLVVLNACESARLQEEAHRGGLAATLLRAGVPAVLAMQYRVPDDASVLFGRTFFSALFQGRTLERALQNGRYALLAAGGRIERHFATPVLYLSLAEGGRLNDSSRSVLLPAHAVRHGKPFRYLESFGEEDSTLFFGREKAIEALVSRVANNVMLVVHGRSGIGKTSLLQAGFAQSAAKNLYLPVTVRLLQDPVKALDEALERALLGSAERPFSAGAPGPARSSSGVAAIAPFTSGVFPAIPPGAAGGALPPARLPAARTSGGAQAEHESLPLAGQRIFALNQRSHRTVLLILDQFEEFFTLIDADARRKFLQVLHALYRSRSLKLRIVIIIREDFFFALDSVKEFFPTITHNTYAVLPLSEDEARSAFRSPLKALGIQHDDALVARVVADLKQEGVGVDPVSLQIVGHHLYEKSRVGRLSLEAYEELGGAQGILSVYLSDFIRTLPAADQPTAQGVLEQFVTRDGTRKPATIAEICRKVKAAPEQIDAILRRLETGRLVQRVQTGAEQEGDANGLFARWELTHEVLITGVAKNRSGIARLGYDLELRKLQRRLRGSVALAAGILSAALIVVTLLGVSWVHTHYGTRVVFELPSRGGWTLRLYPGQESCDDPKKEVIEHHVDDGAEIAWSFPPVGEYEAEVSGPLKEPVRFPVRVDSLGWNRVRVRPPVPVPALHGLELVYVDGGPVQLGLDPSVDLKMGNEWRTAQVAPFYISRNEVTRGQFRQFVEEERYETAAEGLECHVPAPPGQSSGAQRTSWREPAVVPGVDAAALDSLPVVNITLADARAFAAWLSKKTQETFRIPNEDQWEKAARGLDGRDYPWGSCFAFNGQWANVQSRGSYYDKYPLLAPVGTFPSGRSPHGADDMAGNVFELTESCYTPRVPGSEGDYIKSAGPTCANISARGGGYLTPWAEITTSFPAIMESRSCALNVGFRVVMIPREAAGAEQPPAG